MTPERWSQIKEVFFRAREKTEEDRNAYLDSACKGDQQLRGEIALLLAKDKGPSLPRPGNDFLESIASQLEPGEMVAQYRVEAKLGEGGMGAVYRAHDTRLRREVALKVLPLERLSDPEAKQRLLREARAASALNHPNIVTVHEVGSEHGADFLAMEFVEGKTLKELIPAEGLPLKEVLDYAVQIAGGLAKAHAAGIVHRDLKPGNIMVTPDGVVKLLDFGLARHVQLAESETATLTVEGEIAGTPAYMSPEQARGEKVDARTDLFSFGAVLYEMATGKRAFAGTTTAVIHDAILNRAPTSPLQLNPDLPRRLEEIIGKALTKDREVRYQAATELRADLARLKRELETGQPVAQTLPSHAARTRARPPRGRTAVLAISVVLLAAAAVAVGLNFGGARGRLVTILGAGRPKIDSLAVLPLANLSGDSQQEYFAEGMTDELITALSKIGALRVISRTSAMRYHKSDKPLPQIARELNVDAVVEGSVLRSGDRVRITVQLIQARPERHLWAQSYERDLRDVLALQSGVARSIVSEISTEVSTPQLATVAPTRVVNPEAYDAYLKGWYFFGRSQYEKAASYFEEATNKDPTFALAHALFFEADSMISFVEDLPLSAKALAAMEKARQLDDNLAEVHSDFGDVKAAWEWNWKGAEVEYRRAVELDPRSADAAVHYAGCLHSLNRWDAALAEYRRALELDPVSPRLNTDLLEGLVDAHRYDQAIDQFRKAIELDPANSHPYWVAGGMYQNLGRDAEAMAAFLKAESLSGATGERMNALKQAVSAEGLRGYWRKQLEELQKKARQSRVPPLDFASIYVRLGANEQAMKMLEASYQQRAPRLIWIRATTAWDPLRSDPRFQDLLRRMNFPP